MEGAPSIHRLMARREGRTENSIGRNGGTFIAKVTNQQGLPSPSHPQAGVTRVCCFPKCAQTVPSFDTIESILLCPIRTHNTKLPRSRIDEHTNNGCLSSRLASFLALDMWALQQVAAPSSWSTLVAPSFWGKTYRARPLTSIRSPWPQRPTVASCVGGRIVPRVWPAAVAPPWNGHFLLVIV